MKGICTGDSHTNKSVLTGQMKRKGFKGRKGGAVRKSWCAEEERKRFRGALVERLAGGNGPPWPNFPPQMRYLEKDLRGGSNAQWFRLARILGHKYWATNLSICSFARTAHSFALLTHSAALICSLARLLTSKLVENCII